MKVPILKSNGTNAVGRFGWKAQHASRLSFSADAYFNEMGITNRLFPDELTYLCNTARQPNDVDADIEKSRALCVASKRQIGTRYGRTVHRGQKGPKFSPNSDAILAT